MKYNVKQLKDGSFAVDAGRGKYFNKTKSWDRNEAERDAVIMSMNWHREQMEKTFNQGVKFGLVDGDMKDYLC